MNTENMSDEELIAKFKANIGGAKTNATPKDTRYQYPYVELEEVMANPTEYIIPQCLPACRSLWSKNIETFMVSNNDDNDLYVLLTNVSSENMAVFQELQKQDPRFVYDRYRSTVGIAVKGNDNNAMHELESLTEVFRVQDTMRFKTSEDFLESYKYTGGELVVADDGTIHRSKNPELENITLQEALKRSGKESLYVASEGRVYDSPMYLSWHRRYEQSLNDSMQEVISEITPYKGNVDGNIAYLRDVYLSAEREYVTELLKSDGMRELIEQVNSESPDKLFAIAQDIVDKVEMGMIPDEQMERTEKQLTVLLAAIQDKVLSKDLVLTPSIGGRSK